VDPVEMAPAPVAAAVTSNAPTLIAHEDTGNRRPAADPSAAVVAHVVDTRPDGPAVQPFAETKPKTLADLPADANPPPADQPPAPSTAALPPPPAD
jgi:hypothetical protein